jgi:hypothetical protein
VPCCGNKLGLQCVGATVTDIGDAVVVAHAVDDVFGGAGKRLRPAVVSPSQVAEGNQPGG